MSKKFAKRLEVLSTPEYLPLLNQCLHGIERECLRVTKNGEFAYTEHPEVLGSALTNPQITTDYSETLLEFITPAEPETEQTLAKLENIHHFVSQSIPDELLWSSSMPCPLPAEADIPIAYYGESYVGQVKHIYRQGLSVRYGKTMQCIAGIHYNFSLPSALWPVLQELDNNQQSLMDYQSSQYISIIRNFRRYSWLLMYLFGASPALDASFLKQYPKHKLERFDKDSFYLPYATSLRMSDLGYQSDAQKNLTPCYNDLDTYIDSMIHAITTPYPEYEKLGTKDKNGNWLQLNTNILQIENEYYSNIRPKRVLEPGERAIHALQDRGIQYIEVRCMDINPFLPMGIDLTTSYFLNSFLLYCLLDVSNLFENDECSCCSDNFLTTVKEGRRPDLTLVNNGKNVSLRSWADELLNEISHTAQLLDQSTGSTVHMDALAVQREKILNPSLLPSEQVLSVMREQKLSFREFSLMQSKRHDEYYKQPMTPEVLQEYEKLAQNSLKKEAKLVEGSTGTLDEHIKRYLAL